MDFSRWTREKSIIAPSVKKYRVYTPIGGWKRGIIHRTEKNIIKVQWLGKRHTFVSSGALPMIRENPVAWLIRTSGHTPRAAFAGEVRYEVGGLGGREGATQQPKRIFCYEMYFEHDLPHDG